MLHVEHVRVLVPTTRNTSGVQPSTAMLSLVGFKLVGPTLFALGKKSASSFER